MSDTMLLSSMVEEELESSTPGVRTVRFTANGDPHGSAIVNAVIDAFERERRDADWPQVIETMLRSRLDEKVTLVTYGENMLGARMVKAHEGRPVAANGRIALLPKGKRTKGFYVDCAKVLNVIDGWNVPKAQAAVARVRDRFPQLRRLTQERLLELPGEGGDSCSLAVFGSYRLPDCVAHDALWLIGEYWPEDDICDRCVLLLRPEHGFSEPGSVYGKQLLSLPVGEVVGFEPVSWRDAVRLTGLEYDEAVAWLAERKVIA